jgi:hypothetical protein
MLIEQILFPPSLGYDHALFNAPSSNRKNFKSKMASAKSSIGNEVFEFFPIHKYKKAKQIQTFLKKILWSYLFDFRDNDRNTLRGSIIIGKYYGIDYALFVVYFTVLLRWMLVASFFMIGIIITWESFSAGLPLGQELGVSVSAIFLGIWSSFMYVSWVRKEKQLRFVFAQDLMTSEPVRSEYRGSIRID